MKRIRLDESTTSEITRSFEDKLRKSRADGGKLEIKQDLKIKEKLPNASIIFDEAAFSKMCIAVMTSDKEIGWHMTARKLSDTEYYLDDVLIYPQEVTGVTVTTDEEELTKWRMTLEDEQINNLFCQCHSHVNMSVFPSGTDFEQQKDFLSQLSDEDFYIFIVVNKKLEMWTRIFDMKDNIMYESGDIDIYVGNNCLSVVTEIKEKVKQQKRTTSKKTQSSYSAYTSPAYIPSNPVSSYYANKNYLHDDNELPSAVKDQLLQFSDYYYYK